MDPVISSTTFNTFVNPKVHWHWDVFGGSLLTVNLTTEAPLWRRMLTRVFLGSKWKRADNKGDK